MTDWSTPMIVWFSAPSQPFGGEASFLALVIALVVTVIIIAWP